MKANDKVICINDDWSKNKFHPRDYFNDIPVKGKIYVISEIGQADNGEIGLKLVGIRGNRPGHVFYHWRFRRLEELKEQNKKEKNTYV